MKINIYSLVVAVVIVISSSCSSYKKLQYSKEAKGWEQNTPAPGLVLKHTMYLIGDAGNDSPEHKAPVLLYLKDKLAKESKNSSALFLGDNIYEYGMPPAEDSAKRKVAEYRITSQLETLNDFQGRPFFIPGNHDWRGWGRKGLKRQEAFIQSYLNIRRGKPNKEEWENYFLPQDGCSGPEVIELNDNVVVIAVDSQWWLTDWDKDSKINDGCEIKNRATFNFVFENIIRKYRNKNVVIAMHHPPYTYGPHGGKFTIKQHIFPLTEMNPNLYIPLPGIGSLSAIFRGTVGSRQDTHNKLYKDMRDGILAAARKNGNFIFASGHEHALQFIENDGQDFVVSGSGSKNSPIGMGKGSEFASTALGYSTLSFYEGGETWVQYWEVDADGRSARIVFQKKIKDKLPVATAEPTVAYKEYEQHADSSRQFVLRNEIKPVNGFHNFLFGAHHRDLYMEKYPFPVLDLATFKGGVVPVKQGGGNQTNSLRVRGADGKEYVFRDMTKDVSRFLPYPFNKMMAAQFLAQENFLSTHPFAPLTFPKLADAIQVYHTNPQIYYVPAQPGLGVFNQIFGGSLSLVEERPDGKRWKEAPYFGNADKIISTPDLLEKILESDKDKVDEKWALKTRFLDLITGDWDRHDDQWTWASIKQPDGSNLYRPIPRDRDQAFSKYDGLVTNVARLTMPFLRQLQVYGPEVPNMKWTTWSARLFDRTFLNGLDWKQWEEQIRFVQTNLTDQMIEGAFSDWPEKAREMSAAYMIKSIKTRRDNLRELARKHYEFLGQSVNVIGTEEEERFEIERIDDQHTRVTVSGLGKKGQIKQQNYQRVFDHAVTKVINVYGNGNEDEFVVRGDVEKGIKVRLIGGTGKDVFTDSSRVHHGGKKTIVYDDFGKNTINAGGETKDKRTSLYRYNIYDRRSAESDYDITIPLPIIGFNPDDGVLVGANFNMIKYGFKKEPYASFQHFGGSYSFATKAVKLNYTGDFLNAFKSLDFYLDTYYHGPAYAFNYAGLGNTSERPVDNPNFYRVRQRSFHVYPAIKKKFAGNSGFVTLGPLFEISDVASTAGRFITSDNNQLPDDIFKTKYYSGGQMLFNFSSVDNIFAPHSGIRFNSGLNFTKNLREDKHFAGLKAQLAFFISLDRKENLILASQIGTGLNFGKGYEFFQMPTIGGNQGLRGYRTQRFYGKSSLWHATDLRARLGSSVNPTLPLTYGLFGSFDYGRVWQENDVSKNWHYSYGGGIWIAPVDILTLSVGAFIPKEKKEEKPRIAFQVGFWF
ncbi:metallophosphoesterase [Dyadobacter sp. LHD-138]|uniref:metallophosphoesterase n=1 Tax=Dyadobacter sp. LHD-138 TaxID=3071413 RepID=UPI0027E11FA7|nr:metallophosphoesterase [Dyadobacter sp. LHD-138]MDQ6479289.1 metallophosphoesterase [Dyadobacter sp. LHD-138]